MFLPSHLYKYPQFLDELEGEGRGQPVFVQESISYENEPLIKIQGTDIPYRLNVGDEELEAINIFKASLIAVMTALNPISLLSVTKRNVLATRLNKIGCRSIKTVILKHKHWSKFHKEFYILVFGILLKFKIEENKARELAEYISYAIEYDTAYKTRLQDMFNETSPERFNRPVKEIRRLFKLFVARSKDKDMIKYKRFVDLLTLAFLLPNISWAIEDVFMSIEWKNLCPDEIDEYWMSMKSEYDYFGKTLEERLDFNRWEYPHKKEEYLNTQL